MKTVTVDKGIVDLESNLFVYESLIEQNLGFTPKRQRQVETLFGQSIENILTTQPENDNRYVAFVSIRWGFAYLLNKNLTPTEKWFNRHLYDRHGHPIIKLFT